MTKSTEQCRKGCDVYEDWLKLESQNVDLVLDKELLMRAADFIIADFVDWNKDGEPNWDSNCPTDEYKQLAKDLYQWKKKEV